MEEGEDRNGGNCGTCISKAGKSMFWFSHIQGLLLCTRYLVWVYFVLPRLARVYILINGPHGVTKMDNPILETLQSVWEDRNRQGMQFTLQAVLTKCDQMPKSLGTDHIHKIERDIRELAPACLLVPPILTSARIPEIGVENLRDSMVDVVKREPP